MKYVGAHVGTDGGVQYAPLNAHAIGARAFALFTKCEKYWRDKPLSQENIRLFRENCEKYGFSPDYILPHDSYLINLGNPDEAGLEKSRKSFLDEMKRCEQLGLKLLNFHPGSSLRKVTDEECLETIAASLNLILKETSGVCAVIENTAGQGSNLGYSFEQLAYIIGLVDQRERVGVCIDTCHAFAAGYDLKSEEGYEETWQRFDEVIGMEYLRGMHLNDSKRELGSRIDRHEEIGKGELGIEPFRRIMHDPRFDNMPLILETPDAEEWKEKIEMLYSL